MTAPSRMPAVAAREARRLHLRNPDTYTVAMLARRFSVSIACLRESMEAVGQARKAAKATKPPAVLPPEQEVRRRMVALERADTRDLTGRILDCPRPGRSALDRRRCG